jgi:quinol monooxygenase YgiN
MGMKTPCLPERQTGCIFVHGHRRPRLYRKYRIGDNSYDFHNLGSTNILAEGNKLKKLRNFFAFGEDICRNKDDGGGQVSSGKIHIRGHIDVPAADLAMFEAALKRHVHLSRAEPGCEQFTILPVENHPGRFAVTEVFRDQAAFDAHTARTRASDWWQATCHIPRHLRVATK